MATVKREVVHPKLNFRVNGKTQRVEVGSEIEISTEMADKLGDKVRIIKSKKSVKADEKEKSKEEKSKEEKSK